MNTQQKDTIYTRIDRLMDKHSRTMPVYLLLNEILFLPLYKFDSASIDFEEKLEKVEVILSTPEAIEDKVSELKKLKQFIR